MAEKQIGFGRFFVQEAIRAGTWGAVFLLVMAVLIAAMKQDIKEGIAFGVDRLVSEAAFAATDRALIGNAKQLVKRGIDYSVMKAAQGTRDVLAGRDWDVKSEGPSIPQSTETRTRSR
jgi:hypothetical protein